MAEQDVSITSASGETSFVHFPVGRGFVGATGSISAGGIDVVVKSRNGSTEFVADTIDATTLQTNGNEAGTGYSFFEAVQTPFDSQVALKANAAFVGSVTVSVIADQAY